MLTELLRSYYRGISLANTSELQQELANAGFAFTRKRFGDEIVQQIVSKASYCDRKKIKERKLMIVERMREEKKFTGKMSVELCRELKDSANAFIFDAADSRFWGKIFLEIKAARYDDFKVLGL